MEFDASQYNILNLADSFIEQMIKIRNTLRIMSISALILAPFAIGLAIYLINHPSFFMHSSIYCQGVKPKLKLI